MSIYYLDSEDIYNRLYEAIKDINKNLEDDINESFRDILEDECSLGRKVIENIIKNNLIAKEENIPICQDTGMIWMLVEIGKNVLIEGEPLNNVIEKAIENAYNDGYFRKSIVKEPVFKRENTGTNLPAVIYYDYKDKKNYFKIYLLSKGFGSENCSKIYMMNPTSKKEEIIQKVCETVEAAGGSPCPPLFIGIGIGGTMDYAAFLSKKALFRKVNEKNKNEEYAELEEEIKNAVNKLNIGPGGLGGKNTVISVKIEEYGTHIAGLPLAITINCWADRRRIIEF